VRPSTKQVAAALAAVALAFTALRACSSDDGDDRPTQPAPLVTDPGDQPIGPTRVDHDVPMGWRHDAAGARAAAMSAVGMTGPVARAGFITRRDMIDQLATTRYKDTLASTSARQLDDLMGDLGSAGLVPADLLWAELALTARVVDATPRRARVDVWTVLVIGAPGVGVPRQAWRTVTVELAWERDDWRIDRWASEPGPTPVLDELTDTASLEELQRVTAWPAASSIDGGA